MIHKPIGLCQWFVFVALLTSLYGSPCLGDTLHAKSFTEGKELAQKHHTILLVVLHGSDWNLLGEEFLKEKWPQTLRKAATSQTIIVTDVDWLQGGTKNVRERNQQRNVEWPSGHYSVPAVFLFGPEGKQWGLRQRLELFGAGNDCEQVVQELVTAGLQRLKLDSQRKIAQSTDDHSAELQALATLLTLPLDQPSLDLERIKQLDPDDEFGIVAQSTFPDFYQMINQTTADIHAGKMLESEKRLKKMLKHKTYHPSQRARIHLALGWLYHRWENHREDAIHSLTTAIEIAPDSYDGIIAKQRYFEFYGGVSISHGWSSRHFSDKTTSTFEIQDLHDLIQPGSYLLTFQYQKGKSALQIDAVRVYDGNTLIVEDVHQGMAGSKHTANEYRLHVPQDVSELRVEFDGSVGENSDSSGIISWKRSDE